MVTYFSDHIPGFRVIDGKSEIIGKIKPPESTPILNDLIFARNLAMNRAEIKGIVTGPVTMVFFSELSPDAPYSGFRDPRLYEDVAEALAVEIGFYEKAGIKRFQIDEPSFSLGAPLDIGKKVLENMLSGIKGERALHVCGNLRRSFGEIVKIEEIEILCISFKDFVSNFDTIERRVIEDYSKKLGFGCISTMNATVDNIESIKRMLKKGLEKYGRENIAWIHPDCGLRAFSRDIAFHKLKNMVIAVKEVMSSEF